MSIAGKNRLWAIPLLVFILLALISTLAAHYADNAIQNQHASSFQTLGLTLQGTLNSRSGIYVNSLYGAKGLFSASHSVERNEWHAYAATIDITDRYPGISSLAYIPRVSAANKDAFEKQVQNDTSLSSVGYPDFKIYPDTQKSDYYPFTYVEPAPATNAIYGFDISSEATRAAALQNAEMTGDPQLTGLVMGATNSKPSFSVYMPIYTNDESIDTQQERMDNFEGVVVAAFSAQTFFPTILNSQSVPSGIGVQVRDVTQDSSGNGKLLYDNNIPTPKDALVNTYPVSIAGRLWSLQVDAPNDYGESPLEQALPMSVLIFGLILSLAVAWLLYSFATSRQHALQIADKITNDLRESEEKYRAIFESMQDIVFRSDMTGHIQMVSPSVEHMLGYTPAEVIGKSQQLFAVDPEHNTALREQVIAKGSIQDMTQQMKTKQGGTITVTVSAHTVLDTDGKPMAVEGVIHDISERKNFEDELKKRTEDAERLNKIMVDRELKMVELKNELKSAKGTDVGNT